MNQDREISVNQNDMCYQSQNINTTEYDMLCCNSMKEIALQVISYKEKSKDVERRLCEIDMNNKNNLELMKIQYEMLKPEIDNMHKTI